MFENFFGDYRGICRGRMKENFDFFSLSSHIRSRLMFFENEMNLATAQKIMLKKKYANRTTYTPSSRKRERHLYTDTVVIRINKMLRVKDLHRKIKITKPE